jgi:PKD repeat protein
VTLTVTDNAGATNSVSHSVTVSAANQSPTAAFTSSCSNLSCTFTNSSSDPDGTIASNSWTFGDGGTSTAQSPSHSYAAAGTYTVTLTVTDNAGATNSVSHSVTVTAPNQPPVAVFTSSCSSLNCNFTSTSSDPDGTISSYSWTFGDGGTSAVQNPSHSYSAGGTYTVTLRVTDNQGATNSVSHSVTVTAPNQPPVAAFSSSCSNLSCSFTSTSSDPDGSISSYSWTFGDGGTSSAQNPTHSYSAGGTYTVTLRVTDNQGATNSVSHTVTVTAPNTAPVVNAGADETVLLGVLYTLNASFSDPDNGPWTYTINWGDGSTSSGSKSSAGTITAGHTYLGLLTTRTITVTVTDSKGASGSDQKVITLIL